MIVIAWSSPPSRATHLIILREVLAKIIFRLSGYYFYSSTSSIQYASWSDLQMESQGLARNV